MMLWRGLCKEAIQLCMLQAHRCAGTYTWSSLKDHYQVLGVGRKATSEEIKNAFFTLSKKCHPDSDPTNPLLHSQFVRLNEAYKVLSKHSSRMEYDQVLEAMQRENWGSGRSPYKSSSTSYSWRQSYQTEQGPFTRSSYEDKARYWSDFPPTGEWKEDRRQRNVTLVLYCFLVAGLSIFIHFEIYSTFRDIRRKESDEQQMRILKFYNERKEIAKALRYGLRWLTSTEYNVSSDGLSGGEAC
ncbi:dnaJ homolog subfamily C member 4 isoform X2 [Hyla sarda]|uniref:dnaJ homolog subfamily C member 4 isoform X2 n=1 Tax=Hyla sarda TaxID=327740 RepID=UPI0024C4441A|nr:dnaJ homolog subfamily C member 4 isoform X2 [Hyla sarda]